MFNHAYIDFFQDMLNTFFIPNHLLTFPIPPMPYLDLGLRETILQAKEGDDFNSLFNAWISKAEPSTLYFLTDKFYLHYTVLQMPESEQWLFCGPILYEEMTAARFHDLFSQLGLEEEFFQSLYNYYLNLTTTSKASYEHMFFALAKKLYGDDKYQRVYSDVNEMDLWLRVYRNIDRCPEHPLVSVENMEKRYQLENALLDAVSRGNEQRAIELLFEFLNVPFPLRLADELRDNKDLTITFNTLLRKIAEQAGVHPIHIDSYSNSNVQMIEKLTSVEQCNIYKQKLVHGYCLLIHRHTIRDHSLLIQKTITCINSDLQADLSLNSLAKRLSVSSNYLSTLFKKEMGISLTDYVNKCRLETAGKLLRTTNDSVQSIAQQCGIKDVYYFNRIFKRMMGVTPKAFRETTDRQMYER